MVATPSPVGQFNVPNGAIPCEGTKAFPFNLDYTGGQNAYLLDFTSQYQQGQFTTLQTVWIDNSNNPDPLEVVCNTTNQIIVAPPMSQGYYDLFVPSPPKLIAQTNGSLVLTVIFLNFYIPPAVWQVPTFSAGGLPEVDVPALDAVIVGGRVQTDTEANTLIGPTDASGTITAGGVRQSLFALNPARKRWLLSNPSGAAEILQFSYVSNTGGLIDLPPGTTWDESDLSVSGDQVWVVGATNAHAFTAYAW